MSVKVNFLWAHQKWKVYALNVLICCMDMKIASTNLKMVGVFTVIGMGNEVLLQKN